jgi:hypothetical protein
LVVDPAWVGAWMTLQLGVRDEDKDDDDDYD